MNFATNLKLLRAAKSISQEEMSQKINVTRSSLSAYEVGTAEPSFETLIRISDFFHVTTDKLLKKDLSAFSEMQLKELMSGYDIDISGNKIRILATTVDKDNNEMIELIPEKASAGYTAGYADPDYIKVLPTFSMPFLSKEKKYRSFQIKGDSMLPIPSGSFVTGEFIQNWHLIKNGFPYLILTKNDGIVFKQVYNHIKEKNSLHLVSTNPLYDPYDLGVDEVIEVWKFVNYISNETPERATGEDIGNAVVQLQQEMRQIKNVLRDISKK
jgi:transcriptional regulator with XRE-family HTH domain